jgi:Bacterial regulatory proteins, gntR family
VANGAREVTDSDRQMALRTGSGKSRSAHQDVEPRIHFSDPGLIRDRVVEALRDAIVAGRLKPGERIRERELVALLGVSRSPLREAIRILESVRLADVPPHRFLPPGAQHPGR